MKILSLIIPILIFPIFTYAQDDSSLVKLSTGNEYIYSYTYKYNGGYSGSGDAYTINVLRDTVVNSENYYVAKLTGAINIDWFPIVFPTGTDSPINDLAKKDTVINFLMKSTGNSFSFYSTDMDTLMLFSLNTMEVKLNKLGTLGVTKSNESIYGVDTDVWKVYTFENLFGHNPNILNFTPYFGQLRTVHIFTGGSMVVRLETATIDGKYYSGSQLVSTENNSKIIDEIALEQNYPNPFNPATTIPITLDKPSVIKLEVFDTLGRLVELLYQGNLSAGRYEFKFEGESLSTGMYLYRLTTPERVQSKMMLLLK